MMPVSRYKKLRVKFMRNYIKEVPELLANFPDIHENEPQDR